MRIVFCIYNFVTEKLPLQPWLTIRMVGEGLARKGHQVHVVTDAPAPASVEGMEVHVVASLRGSNAQEMRSLLSALGPDVLVFLPTPLNIASTAWLDDLDCRCFGFASYPFYNAGELLTAVRSIGWGESRQYLRHLLVPRRLWAPAMRRRLHAQIAQSATTAARLSDLLDDQAICHYIPPGIDLAQWPMRPEAGPVAANTVRLLYLGAAVAIRGFDVALDALARLGDAHVRLRVLARGADVAAMASIQDAVARRGLTGRVEIEGGWIDRERLIEEIHLADAVLQPFVLVPSELPVTAMEVIACGTPVIGTAIDGLPSTIGNAGTVVKQGSAQGLADAILSYVRDPGVRAAWREGCRQQRAGMQSWGQVTDRWEALLHA